MIKYKQITSLNWKKNIEKKIALKSHILVCTNLLHDKLTKIKVVIFFVILAVAGNL